MREAAAELHCDVNIDLLLLLTSELVTNSVVHAEGVRVEVSVRPTAAGLRVDVGDDGPPIVADVDNPGAEDRHGRGLLIIDRVAEHWGVDVDPAGPKRTWFTLRETVH